MSFESYSLIQNEQLIVHVSLFYKSTFKMFFLVLNVTGKLGLILTEKSRYCICLITFRETYMSLNKER